MDIQTGSYEMEEENADVVKLAIVMSMVRENLIDSKIADEWCTTHTVILKKKSIFRTISNLFLNAENADTRYYIVVKKV